MLAHLFTLLGLLSQVLPIAGEDSAKAKQGASEADWKVGEWGECESTCGGWRSRKVDCWDFTKEIPSASECPYPEPPKAEECPCDSNKCQCIGDKSSMSMSKDGSMPCPDGWSVEDCNCCPTRVVDMNGACCFAEDTLPTIDADGKCCSAGFVDACGVCGGNGKFVDREGTCCQDPLILDASGVCCDGEVDHCGVCNGESDSCGTIIELYTLLHKPHDSEDYSVLEAAKMQIEDIVAKYLNYPRVLVVVQDIDQADSGPGGPGYGTQGGSGGGYGLGGVVVFPGEEGNGYMTVAVKFIVELLPLGSLEERLAMLDDAGFFKEGLMDEADLIDMLDMINMPLNETVIDTRQMMAILSTRVNFPVGNILFFTTAKVARTCGDGVCSEGELACGMPDHSKLSVAMETARQLVSLDSKVTDAAMPFGSHGFPHTCFMNSFPGADVHMHGDMMKHHDDMSAPSPSSMMRRLQAKEDFDTTDRHGAVGEVDERLADGIDDKLHRDGAFDKNLGYEGDEGDEGQEGDEGNEGDEGEEGDEGDEGDEGNEGYTGREGDESDEGDEGDEGSEGQEGDEGNEGDEGEEGNEGDEGDEGNEGAMAPKGGYGTPDSGPAPAPTLPPPNDNPKMDPIVNIPTTCTQDCKPYVGCPLALPPSMDMNQTDQPYPVMCAGHGTCNFDDGTCQCHYGFAGADCSGCAPNFHLTDHGSCQRKFDPATCSIEVPKPPPPPVSGPPGGGGPVFDYARVYGPWSMCTDDDGSKALCDGGIQSRDWTCVSGSSAKEADMSYCMQPDPSDLEQTCNSMPCETFELTYHPWGECSKTCGGGFRTRSACCVSSYGYTAPLSKCEAATETYERCNEQSCTSPYYTYSRWTPCTENCGGGTKTRTAWCHTADGVETEDSVCVNAGIQRWSLEDTCNTRPCVSYVWEVTEWSSCVPATCGGTRTREVTCVKLAWQETGGVREVVESEWVAELCPENVPTTEQSCEPCGFCEDDRLNEGCSNRGACENDECVCEDQWGGAICDCDISTCPSGVLDYAGECCATSVLNRYGQCCLMTGDATPTLTYDGECCSEGTIDLCGVCGGSGLGFDLNGECCEAPGIFDPQMICCKSGNVDACGICDGAGDQCGSQVQCVVGTSVPTSGGSDRRLLQDSCAHPYASALGCECEDVDVQTEVDGTDPTLTNIVLNIPADATCNASPEAMAVRLIEAQTDPDFPGFPTFVGAPIVEKISVCGDDICAADEVRVEGRADVSTTCMEDCPIELGPCPSPGSSELGDETMECGGYGTCFVASRTCMCYWGFAGDACGWCDSETHREENGGCVVRVSSVEALVSTDQPPTPGTRDPSAPPTFVKSGDERNNAGMIVGLVFMALVVAAAAVGAGWAYKTGRIGGASNKDQYITQDYEGGPVVEGIIGIDDSDVEDAQA